MNKEELVIMSNDGNPIKKQLIEAIQASAFTNQLGYLDGMDPDTGEIVPLLVGIDRDPDGNMAFYPIAKLFLSVEELKRYLTLDEHGNYVNNSHTDKDGLPITADFDSKEESGPTE